MHTFKITKLQNTAIFNVRKIDKRLYSQVHLFGVMFHGRPVRLGEEWGSPSEVKVVFTGINPTGVLEVRAEDTCQSLVGAIFSQQHGTNPIINHTGV